MNVLVGIDEIGPPGEGDLLYDVLGLTEHEVEQEGRRGGVLRAVKPLCEVATLPLIGKVQAWEAEWAGWPEDLLPALPNFVCQTPPRFIPPARTE